eukprot:928294-Rhodomonas_salina.1
MLARYGTSHRIARQLSTAYRIASYASSVPYMVEHNAYSLVAKLVAPQACIVGTQRSYVAQAQSAGT